MSNPKEVNPEGEILVDAPAGAEAFAAAEGHESHHSLVGVEKESINVGAVFGIVFGTVVIIVALIAVGFTVTLVTTKDTVAQIAAEADYPEIREIRAAAAARLEQYDVVDAEAATFQIPIDQAINLIVNEEYQNQAVKNYTDELVLLPYR
ncbi:MAG: hypothetical protein AB8G77_25435 [Rhodothermales bacterium]